MTKVLTRDEIDDFKNHLMFDDNLTILSIRVKSIGKNQSKYTIIIDNDPNAIKEIKPKQKQKSSSSNKKQKKEPNKEKIIMTPKNPIPPQKPPMAEITSLG